MLLMIDENNRICQAVPEPGHAFRLAPSSDGEFAAACSCGWKSFGTYASARAQALVDMHEGHRAEAIEKEMQH